MPGCKDCREAADTASPEQHCRQGGKYCTCQCRVTGGEVVIEFEIQPPTLEEKFHDILMNALDYYRVPGGVVSDLVGDLIDAVEE